MARARNIKPGFFQNDGLGELAPIARLLFIGLWTICDFKGCLEYRPKRIKAQLLPYDECDTERLLINLDSSGFIAIYSVLGRQYIKIINFERHQNPHKNERDAGSAFPDLSEKDNKINDLGNIEINLDKDGTAPADSLIPHPNSLLLNPSSLNPEPIQKQPLATAVAAAAKKVVVESEPNPTNLLTWQAYKKAYTDRYSVPPVRDAATNVKIKSIVKGLGEEAPLVAAFFVSHNGARYVAGMHQIGMLATDYAKLRTEWATNTKMTQTKAQQADKTATNFDAFAPLIAEARAREKAEREQNANQ